MSLVTNILIILMAAWALGFLISIPILAALMHSSQLSREEESLIAGTGPISGNPVSKIAHSPSKRLRGRVPA